VKCHSPGDRGRAGAADDAAESCDGELSLSPVRRVNGLAICFYAPKGFLVRMVPDTLPRLNDLSISWGVLLFALRRLAVAGVISAWLPRCMPAGDFKRI